MTKATPQERELVRFIRKEVKRKRRDLEKDEQLLAHLEAIIKQKDRAK
jgi:hypothetical protein